MDTPLIQVVQPQIQPLGGSRVSDSTDHQLVVRAQEGDMEALGSLYDRHQQSIYRFLLSRLSHEELAEDMTGEVFLRMLSGLGDFQSSQQIPFRAWLYRIARNLLVDHYRKEGGRFAVALAEDSLLPEALGSADNFYDPDTTVEHKLTLQQVAQALAGLDEIQRDVIMLRFLGGLSVKEVAEVLDKSAAVKAMQHRGLLNLHSVLAQEQK